MTIAWIEYFVSTKTLDDDGSSVCFIARLWGDLPETGNPSWFDDSSREARLRVMSGVGAVHPSTRRIVNTDTQIISSSSTNDISWLCIFRGPKEKSSIVKLSKLINHLIIDVSVSGRRTWSLFSMMPSLSWASPSPNDYPASMNFSWRTWMLPTIVQPAAATILMIFLTSAEDLASSHWSWSYTGKRTSIACIF